jgi:hypothetical protein
VLTQIHDTCDRILAQFEHVTAASLPLIAEHKRKTLNCWKKLGGCKQCNFQAIRCGKTDQKQIFIINNRQIHVTVQACERNREELYAE